LKKLDIRRMRKHKQIGTVNYEEIAAEQGGAVVGIDRGKLLRVLLYWILFSL
jgi:hypothetical protein